MNDEPKVDVVSGPTQETPPIISLPDTGSGKDPIQERGEAQLTDIWGHFPQVQSAPTDFPKQFEQSIQVSTVAGKIYYYDYINNVWREVSGTGTRRYIYLLSGTSFAVPSDWNSSDNLIQCIGAGAGGGGGKTGNNGGAGGGGGAYAQLANLTLTPGAAVTYSIGTGGAAGTASATPTDGGDGTDTYFNGASFAASSVGAKAGRGGQKGQTGGGANTAVGGQQGLASASIGDIKFDGGVGGDADGFSTDGAGGGGAGGPFGAGGGGGNANPIGTNGGAGDSGHGGVAPGGNGSEINSNIGAGAGGGASNHLPAAGGLYGGAGGGGNGTGSPTNGGVGAQGVIIISYVA